VEELNNNMLSIPTRGTHSKYFLFKKDAAGHLTDELEMTGKLSIEFAGVALKGVACDITSLGFHAVCESFSEVTNNCLPYSICGSLPLVRDMKDEGFDLQITGFGRSDVYHADNEFCLLSDMTNAFKIMNKIVAKINDKEWNDVVSTKDHRQYMPEIKGGGSTFLNKVYESPKKVIHELHRIKTGLFDEEFHDVHTKDGMTAKIGSGLAFVTLAIMGYMAATRKAKPM